MTFVFVSEAAVVLEDTPSTLLHTEDISRFYGQTPPLAGLAEWINSTQSLFTACKKHLLPPHLLVSPPPVIWPVQSPPPMKV